MRTLVLALLVFVSCRLVAGQTQYKVLWNFAGSSSNDGANPAGDLTSDRTGNLYGTTKGGGATKFCTGCGTIFELSPNPDGTWAETVLYNFCSDFSNSVCLDGAIPAAGLIFDAKGNLYGTTIAGGAQQCAIFGGCGTVFELSPPSAPGGGWSETVLYTFCAGNSKTCPDGAMPTSRLALDASGSLYGTTTIGGNGHSVEASNGGTVFKLSHSADGWAETVLYNFCTLGQGSSCPDGSSPQAGVTFDKLGNLYGTTELGGAPQTPGGGTVYKLSPGSNSWIETVLKAGRSGAGAPMGTVSFDPLGNLYTTFLGGSASGAGGIFRLASRGGSAEYSFNGTDGEAPTAGVLIDAKHAALYGTTSLGGTGFGNVFKIVAPAQEIVLYTFCSQSNCTDGNGPMGGLIEDKSVNLYGTTKQGGANNQGVVFEIVQSLPKQNVPQVWHTILPARR